MVFMNIKTEHVFNSDMLNTAITTNIKNGCIPFRCIGIMVLVLSLLNITQL